MPSHAHTQQHPLPLPQPKPFPAPPAHLLTSPYQRVDSFSSVPSPSNPLPLARKKARKGQEDVGGEEDRREVGEGEEEQWEYEEEEHLVVLDVGSEAARLLKSAREISLTGLETATPLVRIGGTLFLGKWDELLGTELLFSVEKPPSGAKTRTVNPVRLHPSPQLDSPLLCASSATGRLVLYPAQESKPPSQFPAFVSRPSAPLSTNDDLNDGHDNEDPARTSASPTKDAQHNTKGAKGTGKAPRGRPKLTDEDRAEAGVLRALRKFSINASLAARTLSEDNDGLGAPGVASGARAEGSEGADADDVRGSDQQPAPIRAEREGEGAPETGARDGLAASPSDPQRLGDRRSESHQEEEQEATMDVS